MVIRLSRLLLLVVLLLILVNCQESGDDNATSTYKQTFKEAEKEISDYVNEKLRALLPKIVGGAGDTSLSQKCTGAMMKIFAHLRRLKGWTLKFLDSIGKPTSGILKGTSTSMGHYDECIDLAVTSKGQETHNISEAMFQGMYCTVKIRFADVVVETARKYHRGEVNETELGKLKEIIQASPYVPLIPHYMSHYVGICLPSICSLEDVKELLKIISVPAPVTLEKCEIKSTEDINSTQFTVLCIFLVLICLACVSTFIDWILHNKVEDKLSSRDDKRCVSVVVAFSFCNNTKRLMKNIEEDSGGALSGHCIRGIVVASVAYIIVGHTYLFQHDTFYKQSSSLENLRDYLSELYFTLVVNSPLAVDALFVSYGFIMTYTLWYAACRDEDVKVKIISLIIQNYIRICIPVLFCLGITFLFPLFGSGPFWKDIMDNIIYRCYENADAYIGMYSNFLGVSEQCFPHLWFTSCLAQLCVIGVFLSWILSKSRRLGVAIIVLLVLIGNIIVGIYTYNNNFPPSYIAYFDENTPSLFWKLNYSLLPSHFGPYALGMLTGIFVARRSRYPLKPMLSVIGWIVCILVLGGLLLFTYKYHMESMNSFWSALYASSHRTLFAISIVWIIVACSSGSGGFVNSILSWRIFDPLFKLSFYAYIFHYLIITFTLAVAREHFYYSHLDLILRAISYIVVSYLVSYLLYMILEMPLKSLYLSLSRKTTSEMNLTPLNNFNLNKEEMLSPNDVIRGSCMLWSVYNSKTSVPY